MAQATVISLEEAQAAVELAWQQLNNLQQNLPDCEHVRTWKAGLAAAAQEHRVRLRARDSAFTAAHPEGLPESGTPIR